ncbi:hypothetical protein, partial [Mesorhizobium sp.]
AELCVWLKSLSMRSYLTPVARSRESQTPSGERGGVHLGLSVRKACSIAPTTSGNVLAISRQNEAFIFAENPLTFQ